MVEKLELDDKREAINQALGTFDEAYDRIFMMRTIGLDPSEIDHAVIGMEAMADIRSMIDNKQLKVNGETVSDDVAKYILNITNVIMVKDNVLAFALDNAKHLRDILPALSRLAELYIAYPDLRINVVVDRAGKSEEAIIKTLTSGKWEFKVNDENFSHQLDLTDLGSVIEVVLHAVEEGLAKDIIISEIK